ncbi:MAG: hypothetical protein HPY45_14815 [Anaerolineae bacterium]|nr:hypothetical protein [Anaerolineae bacterium]
MTTTKKKPTHTTPNSPLSEGNEKGSKGREERGEGTPSPSGRGQGEGTPSGRGQGEGILHALTKITGKPPLAYNIRPNGDVSVITWEGKKFLFTKQEIDSV